MTHAPAYCFAADLGGTKLATALADADGRIVAELTETTDPRGAARVAEQLGACASKLAQRARIDVTQVKQATVGVPGAVDPRTGRVSLTPNIEGLEDFDMLGFLRSRFEASVAIENDVNLAMLGEHALGCARGCSNAAFLALGTGAGMGLLIDKQLYRGARGAAGEISDMPIGQEPTLHRPPSAFELEVGSHAILDRYRQQGGTSATTVRDIFSLLERGDPVATSVLDTTARWVAIGVVTLHSLLDLELVVFGGSIGMRPEIYERVRSLLPTLFSRTISIAPSELGDRAGLMGAVWAAKTALRADELPAREMLKTR